MGCSYFVPNSLAYWKMNGTVVSQKLAQGFLSRSIVDGQ